MPPKIRVLDPHTINQIKAGEVIENPASVVKELVENSLDANAKTIHIDIQNGGRRKICITDDGFGMSKDDALLSLERHATSKLSSTEDLLSLKTLGFRGEAIPSIASISKLLLHTSDAFESTLIHTEGGTLLDIQSAPRDRGTTFEIKELFFNTPVRRKFQRSPAFDSQEILRAVTQEALCRPDIHFTVIDDSKEALNTRPTPHLPFLDLFKERILTLVLPNFDDALLRVDGEGVKGYIASPSHHKNNRTGQYLFINGRPLFSPFVSYIVKESFGTTLPEGRHPLFFLHLNLDPDLVDVNVHPQKKEVRLRDQERIKHQLFQAIDQALFPQKKGAFVQERVSFSLPGCAPLPLVQTIATKEREEPFEFEFPQRELVQHPTVLATLADIILCEGDDGGLLLVDQREAHAQILFEKHFEKEERVEVETWAIPHPLELGLEEARLLKEEIPNLSLLGFDISCFGEQSFCLQSAPLWASKKEPADIIRDYLAFLRQNGQRSTFASERKAHLVNFVSRRRFEEGRRLSIIEATLLIKELFSCQKRTFSPGRKPIVMPWTKQAILKEFQNYKGS